MGQKWNSFHTIQPPEKEQTMGIKTRAELSEMYEYVGPFYDGLAKVLNKGKWFHIRLDGNPAYNERYDDVGLFHEGIAWVWKDGKQFQIRPDGTRVE